MRVVLSVLLAAATAAPALAPGSVQGRRPSVITKPDWQSKPSGDDVGRAYPVLAAELGIEGRVVMSCDLDDLGRAVACRALTVAPAGWGFGDAALSISPLFRMKPQTVDGKPVAGGVVRIPLHFTLAPNPPIEAPDGPPPSPEALAVARQILAAIGFDRSFARSNLRRLASMRFRTRGSTRSWRGTRRTPLPWRAAAWARAC